MKMYNCQNKLTYGIGEKVEISVEWKVAENPLDGGIIDSGDSCNDHRF